MPTEFVADLILKAKEDDNGDWLVYAPVVAPDEDYDGETMEKSGILKGLNTFFKLNAHVDWNHRFSKTHSPKDLIGVGLEPVQLVDGVPNLITKLDKGNEIAQELWRKLKAGIGSFGYSIQGIAKARDAKNHKHITETEIHLVTIAPSPKGFKQTNLKVGVPDGVTSLMAIAKAMAQAPPGEEEYPPNGEDIPVPPMQGQEQVPEAPQGDMPGVPQGQGVPPEEAQPAEGQEPQAEPQAQPTSDNAEPVEQLSKQEVEYRPGDQSGLCEACVHFHEGTCELVKGLIRPDYVCDAFEPPEQEQGQAEPQDPSQAPPPQVAPQPEGVPAEKAIVKAFDHAKQNCKNCGGKMYCIHCHRKALHNSHNSKTTVDKAYTVGSGIVTEGSGQPGDFSKTRTQDMLGDPDRKKKKRKKKSLESATVNVTMSGTNKAVDPAVAEAVAKFIRRI